MGRVRVNALPRDLHVFPTWFGPSKFAPIIRARVTDTDRLRPVTDTAHG